MVEDTVHWGHIAVDNHKVADMPSILLEANDKS